MQSLKKRSVLTKLKTHYFFIFLQFVGKDLYSGQENRPIISHYRMSLFSSMSNKNQRLHRHPSYNSYSLPGYHSRGTGRWIHDTHKHTVYKKIIPCLCSSGLSRSLLWFVRVTPLVFTVSGLVVTVTALVVMATVLALTITGLSARWPGWCPWRSSLSGSKAGRRGRFPTGRRKLSWARCVWTGPVWTQHPGVSPSDTAALDDMNTITFRHQLNHRARWLENPLCTLNWPCSDSATAFRCCMSMITWV